MSAPSSDFVDRRIAIVGKGGVFPGAADLDAFWRMILDGRSASKPVPADRWIIPPAEAYDPTPGTADKVYATRACFVEDFALDVSDLAIDAELVARLDPAFHFALAAGRMAWQDCAKTPADPRRIGVILGNIVLPTEATNSLTEEYLTCQFAEKLGVTPLDPAPFHDRFDPCCRDAAHLPAAILAKALGLEGRTLCIDAACASSLYALKLAADELLAGRADAMLAGGVSRPDCLYTQMGFGQLKALSPSGNCSPFDAKADGLVVGEGAGIFVLKRLADAEAAGDRIDGVLCGFGLSNDVGGRLLAPSSEGQLRALRQAYAQAGWSPDDVDLIECHATGTPVGDAVEFDSLRELRIADCGLRIENSNGSRAGSVSDRRTQNQESIRSRTILGGVKSNVGHLLTAAGAAALMKVLFAFRDGVLPPTANFELANPKLEMSDSPFEVLCKPREWKRREADQPRRAAINGFGFGGINAHVLVEEYLPSASRPAIRNAIQSPSAKSTAIAVIAADVIVGQTIGLEDYFEEAFGFTPDRQTSTRLNAIDVAKDRFRIPPVELEDMLPQQLLMLLVADNAIKMAGWKTGVKPRVGAFIGLDLDLDATNFHFRWSLARHARRWANELGADLDEADLATWTRQLRDQAGPPLTANRVMGALGGIVASRVAREFEIGGPCHTVSCEAASGIAGIELAIDALIQGELDEVLIGAVDLAADPRRSDSKIQSADAAAAVVLKRLDDATRDGNHILAMMERRHSSAESCPAVHPAAHQDSFDCGVASGLVDFIRGCLSLDRKMLSGEGKPTAWLQNRAEGLRRIDVSARDRLGKARTLTLVEADRGAEATWLPKLATFSEELPSPNATRQNSKSADAIAFVFAGSGNHYPGMGRELAAYWPEVVARHNSATQHLRSQLQPERFWVDPPAPNWDDRVLPLIVGQVSWSMLACDVVRSLGIEPNAAIGYSLGESSALFALGAWRDRDEMFGRLERSPLFQSDLCGSCNAARVTWQVAENEPIDWIAGIVNASAEAIRKAILSFDRTYLLIVNAPDECVLGGDRVQVQSVVARLQGSFVPLKGVSTVHCPIANVVAEAYRELHRLPTTSPRGIRFYSSARCGTYEVTSESAAAAILAQAIDTVDFARTIETAYADGIRIFIEIGPGNSCSRMIAKTLGDRPHRVYSPFTNGPTEVRGVIELAYSLKAEGFAIRTDRLSAGGSVRPFATTMIDKSKEASVPIGFKDFKPPMPPQRTARFREPLQYQSPVIPAMATAPAIAASERDLPMAFAGVELDAHSAAHDAYLRLSRRTMELFAEQALLHANLVGQFADSSSPVGQIADLSNSTYIGLESSDKRYADRPAAYPTVLDRAACLEYGAGSIANVLGEAFAEADSFPTRVRLPDGPLNFVDRITKIDAVAKSLSHGNVVTEHDVLHDGWYLDNGVMPTCFTVEAGQADLFLSGYLGIDFVTRGLAVYRLLDAKVTFHRGLPRPGEVIRYDIWIDGFFNQGETRLFRFRFQGTIDGQPLLSMRDGCAGFFTAEELASGKGIVHTELDKRPIPGKTTPDWKPFVPLRRETFSDNQLTALRAGDLVACFGNEFSGLPLLNPLTLPGGAMKLIDRVVELDPTGGRYGLGKIRAEADIHSDDWFIVCHFIDDPVMPGTLMYECCLHTLRVLLMRMGWIAEADETVCEPVVGVVGSLKCRGQVLGTTKVAAYEVSIKEIGYLPEPYAIVDALMFADGKPIVEIGGMSLKMTGMTRERLEEIWNQRDCGLRIADCGLEMHADSDESFAIANRRPAIYDTDRILAFAVGKPSDAFGEPYRIFDEGRVIARLPGPPYQFLDRIVEVVGEPFKMTAGGSCVAEYDVPADAWYFEAERLPVMPFSVLLEVALQPCGWLAAYVGSALTGDVDMSFRNLGGKARLFEPVTPNSGTLATEVKMTRCSASGGMVIQNYDMTVRCNGRVVYQGDTYFGFFSKQALANQVGIRDAKLYVPSESDLVNAAGFDFPVELPFPSKQLRMIDLVELFAPGGGPAGLGFIRGVKVVDPAEWFFKAHFFQDPVCPGSLGLESFLQLLKVVADNRWNKTTLTNARPGGFTTSARMPTTHSWVYRGQVIPADRLVTVEATVTAIDDATGTLTADGYLSVDGRTIYQMTDFSITAI